MITLKIPEDLLERLDRSARAEGVSRSKFIRRALEQSLPESGSCFDLAADLIGSRPAEPDCRNDRLMLEAAALGIAVIQKEGAAFAAIQRADVVRQIFSMPSIS